MKRLIRILIALAFIALPLLDATLAFATVAAPDSTPTISNIHANRNLVTSGDMCIYFDYDLPYATPPDVAADEAYLFQLIDTDGTTVLGSVTPFVMFDNGYNEGVANFCFTANVTWGEAYKIRIAQNPTQFTSPNNYDYTISTSAYSSETTQTANQREMASNIIAAALRMETYYTDYTFVEAAAGGSVLSAPTGETYFRGAIYGIQVIVPSLFMVQVVEVTSTSRTWSTTQFNTYEERFSDNWVGTSVNATGTQFGVTPQTVTAMIFLVPVVVGTALLSLWKWKRTDMGLVAMGILLIMAATLGWIPTAVFAAIYQAMGIYLAWVIFGSRSS